VNDLLKLSAKNQMVSKAIECVKMIWAVREALQIIRLIPCRF